jgi:subtilisin family serine protease
MISRFIRPGTLATCIATCLVAGGMTAQTAWAGPALRPMLANPTTTTTSGTQRYIVRFSEAPLALHNRELRAASTGQVQAKSKAGGNSLSSLSQIPLRMKANGRVAMDAQSAQAQTYRAAVSARQDVHVSAIQKALGRNVTTKRRFQSAFNGAVMELSPREVEKVLRTDGVASVQPVREVVPMDDLSTRLIGASSVWIGAQDRATSNLFASLDELFADLNGKSGFKGDGIVIGDIDTGYNSASPSFAATDASGYTHINPLGTGKYIGDCGVDGISIAGCNDKVIGVFDEYNTTAGYDAFSVEDSNGHGSHTSSTQVGNARAADASSYIANISGIAPHANLVFFGICPSGAGCENAAIIGSVEDAINSGIVDTLNLSFGNGNGYEPDYWVDNESLAFLAAIDSGIFVAQSAGNTQNSGALAAQTPSTSGNDAPWVTTVAATTTNGSNNGPVLAVSGPGTPPASVQAIAITEGTYDTPLAGALPPTTAIKLSPTFHVSDLSGTDGCSAYPANTFSNAIALISRGTCGFAVKVPNAIAAGATAVIISDNRVEGAFSPTVGPPQVSVPVFSVSVGDGANLQSFLSANGGAGTASLGFLTHRLPAQADVLADFSLIGPAIVGGGIYPYAGISSPVIDLIKPDIAAPGVAILAALNNSNGDDDNGNALPLNGADTVGYDSGTSMASPHIASSGALVLGVHPSWTPMEVKSALMMTATPAVTKADGKTPASPFDAGSGRVQVYQATLAGLVLDESVDNLAAADPANGGDPSTLNLASMQNSHCGASCTFTRTFTSTQSSTLNWVVTTGGEFGGNVTASPSSFSIDAGKSVEVTFTVDTSRLAAGTGYHFASVTLSPPAAPNPVPTTLPNLHLPIAVAVAAPQLVAASAAVNIDLAGKATGSATLTLANAGSGIVEFAPVAKGSASIAWLNQPSNLGYNAFTATHYTDPGAGDNDFYLADDFSITGSAVNLSSIVASGFTNGGAHALSAFGSSLPVHFRIYADNNGLPASDPLSGDTAVWKYDGTAGDVGVSVANDNISLNLVAAQLGTNLPAGHYWLSVYPDLPCNDTDGKGCTEGWFWSTSWTGSGEVWASTATGASWSNTGDGASNSQYGPGLALSITTNAACQAPPSWLTLSPNGGSTSASAGSPATVTFTAAAAGYAPATSASTYVCFAGGYQDPSLGVLIPKNVVPVQVNATN